MSATILIVGYPRDPTIMHTLACAPETGAEIISLDCDQLATSGAFRLEGSIGDGTSLRIVGEDLAIDFTAIDACYARFIDPPPDIEPEREAEAWARVRLLQLALAAAPFRVVNRPGSGESNDTKPVHTAMLAASGLAVPRGCTTNDRDEAFAFLASCADGAIYKSNSGQRSIVQAVDADDLTRLDLLRACPVYFQERVHGIDIRVHVIGDRCHAVAIHSQDVDYRYDRSGTAHEEPCTIPDDLARRCVRATEALGLAFAGIDLIQRADTGQYVALEANPMPGYHGYDLTLGGAIAADLWRYLAVA